MMKKVGVLITLLALVMITLPALATTIDFGTGLAGVGGTFTITGANASGVNIPIGSLTVTGAPTGNGVYTVTNPAASLTYGFLNFDTATNTISIFGAVPGLGITSSVNLLSGSFSSWTINPAFSAGGSNAVYSNLLADIGLSPSNGFNFFGFALTTSGLNPDTIISTDIRDTPTPVPEPASLAMLGSGLLSLGVFARRLFGA
jgi:PEP-CTERM motif